MVKKLVENWVHKPGKHCATSALSDISHFYGINFSEPLCLGLGCGLGFFYMKGDKLTPTRALHTRTAVLEPNFFRSLGIEFAWNTDKDSDKSLAEVKSFVDRGIPVILQSDIYYIDYYKSSTHFTGHVVTAWGYDDEKEIVFLADTQWEGLQELSYASLKRAWTAQVFPYYLENNYFPVRLDIPFLPLERAIPAAMRQQAQDLLGEEREGNMSGIPGMKTLAEEFTQWGEAKDLDWCARFSYQVIERRGTGGSGFRLLYTDFLREAEEIIPSIRPYSFSERMQAVSEEWTSLGNVLFEISETRETSRLSRAGEILGKIREKEKDIFSDILHALPDTMT